jgi:Fic family protein
MNTLFDLFESEPEPSVRAVLGHWLFSYIHPYPDANGRMARFLMNAMLASGGYQWAVIRVETREKYLKALESASVDKPYQTIRIVHRRTRAMVDGAGRLRERRGYRKLDKKEGRLPAGPGCRLR